METQAQVQAKVEPKFRSNSDFARSWVNGRLEIVWRGGEKQVFDPAKAAKANRDHAEQHGWEQRIGDSAALELEKVSGKTERMAAKKAAMQRLIDHYESGAVDWNVRQAVRVAAGPNLLLLLRALMALGKVTDVDSMGALLGKVAESRRITRDEAVALFWAAPDVAVKVAELQIEARPGKISADDLIAGLLDAPM